MNELMNKQEQHVKKMNEIYHLLNIAQAKGMQLYTITYVFNYLRDFRIAGEGERLAEERILFWWKGVLTRLYARPWREELFGFAFMDYGDAALHNPHAHCLLAISDIGYRKRYAGLSFDRCFIGDNYTCWFLPSRNNTPDSLKRYWVGKWDGESKFLSYCMKRYESGQAFYGSSPVYISGELCTPEHIRRKRELDEQSKH